MSEKSEALAYSQLLLLHADSIKNPGVKDMVINSTTELVVLHYQAERLKADNERLREEVRVLRLYGNKDCTAMADEAMKEAALRREE